MSSPDLSHVSVRTESPAPSLSSSPVDRGPVSLSSLSSGSPSPSVPTVTARSFNLSSSSSSSSSSATSESPTPIGGRTVIRRTASPRPIPTPPMPPERSVDTLGNFVPSSCFETAAAISILDRPGKAGETLDGFARQFSRTLDLVYAPGGIGDEIVQFEGKPIRLRDLYDSKIINELRPAGDQIGRCPDPSLQADWLKGAGVKWLKEQLALPSTSPDYNYANMLTKIRVLHPFGAYVIIELMKDPRNAPVVARLLGKDVDVVTERCNTAKDLVWDAEFNSTPKRAREERTPLVGIEHGPGTSLAGVPLRDGLVSSDFGYGRAFGLIYHPDAIESPDLREQYLQDLRKFGQQGIRRVDQPVVDDARPGILSEYALTHMPAPFRVGGLEEQLRTHRVPHGTGLNRWNPIGTYATESRAHNLPAAGSHSGGAANLFVGLNCLSEEPIVGRKDIAEQTGLLFAAFTNIGGYHTFVETFPIAQAVASNTKFRISVGERQGRNGKHLYADFAQAAQEHTRAGRSVRNQRRAYQQCLTPEERIASRRRLPFVVTPLPLDVEDTRPVSRSSSPISDTDAPLSSRTPSPTVSDSDSPGASLRSVRVRH